MHNSEDEVQKCNKKQEGTHTSLGEGMTLTQQKSEESDNEVRKRNKKQQDTPPSVSGESGSEESVGDGPMLIQRKSGEETVRFANARRNSKMHPQHSV